MCLLQPFWMLIDLQDINQAYKALGIDPEMQKTVNDEQLIGIYKSRWSDSSATGQADLKTALRTLGQARNSRDILDAAADSKSSLFETCVQDL